MIAAFLASRVAGPLGLAAALVFAAALGWQTLRIDGWPLIGGGLKAQVAQLQQQRAADEFARTQAEAAALMTQAKIAANAEEEARAHALASRANESHMQTIIERVPADVSAKSDSGCIIPIGAVRLLDAAASGADPDFVAARLAPGVADDAPSGIALSDVVALLATDLAIARDNADQLSHLEKAVGPAE